jgi:hypothetical protein
MIDCARLMLPPWPGCISGRSIGLGIICIAACTPPPRLPPPPPSFEYLSAHENADEQQQPILRCPLLADADISIGPLR